MPFFRGMSDHRPPSIKVKRREFPKVVMERRQAERFSTAVSLLLTVKDVHGAVAGETVSVSETGAFIVTEQPQPIGSMVDLEIQLSNTDLLLHAKGQVVRQGALEGRFGMGIVFESVSYGARELVELLRPEADDGFEIDELPLAA